MASPFPHAKFHALPCGSLASLPVSLSASFHASALDNPSPMISPPAITCQPFAEPLPLLKSRPAYPRYEGYERYETLIFFLFSMRYFRSARFVPGTKEGYVCNYLFLFTFHRFRTFRTLRTPLKVPVLILTATGFDDFARAQHLA